MPPPAADAAAPAVARKEASFHGVQYTLEVTHAGNSVIVEVRASFADYFAICAMFHHELIKQPKSLRRRSRKVMGDAGEANSLHNVRPHPWLHPFV